MVGALGDHGVTKNTPSLSDLARKLQTHGLIAQMHAVDLLLGSDRLRPREG